MKYTFLFKKHPVAALIAVLGIIIGVYTVITLRTAVAAAPQPIARSMYIWSSAFNNYTVEYIETYLQTNNISTAIVSSSNKTAFNQLATRLSAKGTKVELLLGSNSVLTNTNQVAYFDNLFKDIDVKKISALHLDVEPHTLPDYQTKKEYYLKLYVELLKTAKIYAAQKGIKLSVDIPVFYPEATLKEIYTQADTVYLMAYEIQSMNYLATRVSEEMALGKNKTIVAFRSNDFANRAAFETYVTNAMTKLGTSKVAMHDLTRFVNLPQ